jgi:dihydroorotate dehydrogenase (fumarate)
MAAQDVGPRRYLELLQHAATVVDVPVIASLNGATPAGWTQYAHALQEAGAAAIELNIYFVPNDLRTHGRDVEQRHLEILQQVKAAVSIPVAVKLSPQFSSIGEIALRLDHAGADALVLFNRHLVPDIDAEQLMIVPRVDLSTRGDGRLARAWIALLHGRVTASLVAPSASPAAFERSLAALRGVLGDSMCQRHTFAPASLRSIHQRALSVHARLTDGTTSRDHRRRAAR